MSRGTRTTAMTESLRRDVCCLDLLALDESSELGADAVEVGPQCRVLVPAAAHQLQQLVVRRVHSDLTLQVRTKRDLLLATQTLDYFCITTESLQQCSTQHVTYKPPFDRILTLL